MRFKESEKGTENTIKRVDALCNKNLVWNLNSAPFEKWFLVLVFGRCDGIGFSLLKKLFIDGTNFF